MSAKTDSEIRKYIQESDLINNVLLNAEQGVIVYDHEVRYQFWNAKLEEMTGLAFNDVKCKKPSDVFSFLGKNGIEEDLEQMMLDGEQIENEFKFTIDNQTKWVLHHSYPIKNKENKIIGGFTLVTEITKRKTYEEQLKKSEERFNLAVEGSYDGLWDWDVITDDVFYSETWKNQLGYSGDEIKGDLESWSDLLHPEDKDRTLNVLNSYFDEKDKKFYEVEFRMRHKDGSYRWIRARGAASRDENGTPYRMTGSHTDITESKLASDQLKENNRLLSQITHQVPGLIYQFKYQSDGTRTFTFVSDKAKTIYELFPGDLMSDFNTLFKRIHPDDVENVIQSMKDSFDNISIWDNKHRVVLPSKGTRHLHGVAQPEKLVDGSVIWHGYVRDITEEYINQIELKTSQERWQYALEGSQDGIWDWNIKTDEVYFSPQWKKMFGYEEKDITNNLTEWSKRVHPDDLDKAYADIQKHLDGKVDQYTNIHRILCKNGDYKWVYDRGKVMEYDEENNPVRMIGTHTDIHERMKMEQNLRKLNEDKDLFISILTHDLKGPFSSIIGLLEILSKNIEKYDTQTKKQLVNKVTEAANNTYKLLEDILLWSKVTSGKMAFTPETFRIKHFIDVSLKVLKHSAELKGIKLKIQISNDFMAKGDFNMLKTVMRNLVSNAIKFTHKKGDILISAKKLETEILISVSDTGVGMSKEKLKDLFDASKKVSTLGTSHEKGTGVGLLLCKDIIEQHSGKIWVDSKPSEGTQFYFTIPLA